MIKRKIYMSKDDIPDFVNITGYAEHDVTIYRGKYVIDAKSLLGVVAIHSPYGMIIEYSEEDKKFEKKLQDMDWV